MRTAPPTPALLLLSLLGACDGTLPAATHATPMAGLVAPTEAQAPEAARSYRYDVWEQRWYAEQAGQAQAAPDQPVAAPRVAASMSEEILAVQQARLLFDREGFVLAAERYLAGVEQDVQQADPAQVEVAVEVRGAVSEARDDLYRLEDQQEGWLNEAQQLQAQLHEIEGMAHRIRG